MLNLNDNIFNTRIEIPPETQIIFVSDLFVEDYVGGAELTSDALIKSSPFKLFKLHSKDVTIDLLSQGKSKFWIFGNFSQMNHQLIPSIVANLRYSILEYDYKFCRFRSPEKHQVTTGVVCDCDTQMTGKIISAFYFGSMGMWWMSDNQRNKYMTLFPFLTEKDNVTLSSVFDKDTLGKIKLLRNSIKQEERKNWIVCASPSWIKGSQIAEEYCKNNNLNYELVWNLSYDEMLAKLATSEGLVYLPPGSDTCPRMVIEAKLLGCKLVMNDNVQHKDEEWFATDDLNSIDDYLSVSPAVFWSGIKKMMDYKPKISGYVTTYNCIKQEYPFEQCIQSMLQFCDEVCVVDGGSTDETWQTLCEIQKTNEQKLKLKQVVRDWSSPRFAVFDGMQKTEARKMCTGDFCWQMDSDEIVHEDDTEKVIDMCYKFPPEVDLIALPVIEYWGSSNKVRVDVQPWKWRLSRNKKNIVHGIPVELRSTDADGNLCATGGTDGCDMIDETSGNRIPFASFYTQDVDNCRQYAMNGDAQALSDYENWFNQYVMAIPGVFHYSWHNLERKIKLYRDYWTKHWLDLWNKNSDDTAENNMMFDAPWSEITDDMIKEKAKELSEIGGWIWHRKWDGTKTPSIKCNRSEPRVMKK